jgi:hypothetical protein
MLTRSAMAFSIWPSLRHSQPRHYSKFQVKARRTNESFWASVRSEFELTPEFTNLVSVVLGNFTKANREIAFNEATRLSAS